MYSVRNILTLMVCGILQCCCSSSKTVNRIPADSYNLLLQETNRMPRYIFIKKDSAFYERRIFDKRSYFTDFDTLTYSKKCDCYEGRTMRLIITDGIGNLNYFEGRDSGKIYSFTIPSPKELKTWNYYKNTDSYNLCLRDLWDIITIRQDSKLHEKAENDFRNIITLAKTLDHQFFLVELEKFKAKYSLTCDHK